MCDRLLANPVTEGRLRDCRSDHGVKFGIVVFPDRTAMRTPISRSPKVWAPNRSASGTRTTTCRARTSSSSPAASATATTCAPARSRGSAPSCARSSPTPTAAVRSSASATDSRSCAKAHLLPGALLRNASLRFASQWVTLRVENSDTLFTNAYPAGALLRVPIAHGDGRFTADDDTLRAIEDGGQVAFRYVDSTGLPIAAANPNGSLNSIAGIVNEAGNVLGLMPHPEDAIDPLFGSTDGLGLFKSMLSSVTA